MRSLILAALTLTACDAQVDGDHQGEVLATIEGALHSSRMDPLPAPEVAVVWAKLSMMNGLVGAETVAAEGLFPQFTLSIFNPPPDDMLDDLDGELYGVAMVAVGNVGTDYKIHTDWHGVDFGRVVVYLPEDTVPGGTLEAFLHGAQTAGFHVYSVKRLTEEERQARLACVNMIPQNGGMIGTHDIYALCGGAGRDELYSTEIDLDTKFDIEIVEDADIVELINKQPRW